MLLVTRRQQESQLLGFIVGAIASFTLVMVGSLLPWFDGDDTPASAQPVETAAATEEPVAVGSPSPRRGGGPPEGRGPGSQNDAAATADPTSFGMASPEVLDAFAAGGCVACHSIKGIGGGGTTVGPHLFRLGAIAADRRPGASVEAYIEESILDPDAFIMPNCPLGPCPTGVMPQTLADTLSAEDLTTIVEYLAALGTPAEAEVLGN